MRHLTTLLIAATLTLGVQLLDIQPAEAAPGGTLVKSQRSGTRTHKAASSKSTSSKSKSSSSKRTTTRRTTTTRTTTTRSSAPTRTTTTRTTRTTRPTSRTTRTTTHRTSRPASTTRTTTYYNSPRRVVHHRSSRPHYRAGSTTYYSTHYHSTGHTQGTTTTASASSGSYAEGYITGGLGLSGFASNAIVDGALPGLGYNVAIGVKGGLLAGELGFNGGAFTFTPGDLPTDLGVFGMSLDFRVQPSFSFFEPYLMAGIGVYGLADAVISERSAGGGFRLGAGADLRFDNFAVRLGYQFGGYLFDNAYDAYGDGGFTARTEALSANLVVYF